MIKDLVSLGASVYFSYILNFNLDQQAVYLFQYYFICDLLYLIYFEKTNRLKNDLIIHHINSIVFCSLKIILENNYNIPIIWDIFNLQELTTILICFKKIVNYNKINDYLIKLTWIPLRVICPFYSIYYHYTYNYLDIIYYKMLLTSGCVFFILNLKWTFLFGKIIENNDNYSSLFLLFPILFSHEDINFFMLTLLLTTISFFYNITKNRLLLVFDTSIVCCYSLYISYKVPLYILTFIFIGLSVNKYYNKNSELHSLITFSAINYKLKNNYYLLIFNNLLISTNFAIRYLTKETYLWHISNCIVVIFMLIYNY